MNNIRITKNNGNKVKDKGKNFINPVNVNSDC